MYQPFASLTDAERCVVEHLRDPQPSPPAAPQALGLLAPEECSEVYEKVVEGEAFFCPTHPRLRWLLGLVAFDRSIEGAAPLFFSQKQMVAARRELECIERDQPGVRPSLVQSLWHVPPRWFACFADSERRIEQVGDHLTIRYETQIDMARERVSDALDTLTGGIVHPVIIGMIYELKEWLCAFSSRGVLELDYASVATLFEPDDLADDHSAADVWNSIRALGEGDGTKAGLYYRRVNERWAHSRVRESLN